MGNKQPNYNNKVGKQSECPICALQFKSSDTYGSVTTIAILKKIGKRAYRSMHDWSKERERWGQKETTIE